MKWLSLNGLNVPEQTRSDTFLKISWFKLFCLIGGSDFSEFRSYRLAAMPMPLRHHTCRFKYRCDIGNRIRINQNQIRAVADSNLAECILLGEITTDSDRSRIDNVVRRHARINHQWNLSTHRQTRYTKQLRRVSTQ